MNSDKMKETIKFGAYDWLVLDERDDNLLIITRDVIELRPYDSEFTDENWETCTLREYLNGRFFGKFTPDEQARIVETTVSNPKNPWYDTRGCDDTSDKIFLLSIEEADLYFSGGGERLTERMREFDYDCGEYTEVEVGSAVGGFFSNEYDESRQSNYNGDPAFWWLRSPGVHHASAAFVCDSGGIGVMGLDLYAILDVGAAGVRPVLWLKK
jgi:hypothetical protein